MFGGRLKLFAASSVCACKYSKRARSNFSTESRQLFGKRTNEFAVLRRFSVETKNIGSSGKKGSSGVSVTKLFFLTNGVIAAGLGYLYATDEGFRRATTFWTIALPKFFHYKLVEYQTKDKSEAEITAAFKVLHEKYSPVIEQATLELRGYYLKCAQMMSTMDNFVPEAYLVWTKKLQDEVPTELSPETAKDVIENSLGIKIEDVFSEFDYVPIGCASIGQVYKATLKEPVVDEATGEVIETVAVKVQGPGIERRFRSDISIIINFCAVALPFFLKPLEEIERQFRTEFDFLLEADNLNLVHNNIMPLYSDKVKIPKPVMSLCSKEVLVMEFLDGKKFIDAVRENFREVAERHGKDYHQLEQEQLDKINRGEFESIHSGSRKTAYNQFLMDSTKIAYNCLNFVYNWSFGLVFGRVQYVEPLKLINLAEIIRSIAIVHGHEIMIDGCVNGDPHPGNILLLKDGRLGLIDYGQVKHLNPEFRKSYARLILALHHKDVEETCRIAYDELKIRTTHANKEAGYRMLKFWNDSNSDEVTKGLNMYQFLEKLNEEDPLIEQCDDLIVPSRVSILLRAMGNAFGLDISMAELWLPIAETALKEN